VILDTGEKCGQIAADVVSIVVMET